MPTSGRLVVKLKGKSIFQASASFGGDDQDLGADIARWVINRPSSIASFVKLLDNSSLSLDSYNNSNNAQYEYTVDLTKRRVTVEARPSKPETMSYMTFARATGVRTTPRKRPTKRSMAAAAR